MNPNTTADAEVDEFELISASIIGLDTEQART
jgi:hypothetical protein